MHGKLLLRKWVSYEFQEIAGQPSAREHENSACKEAKSCLFSCAPKMVLYSPKKWWWNPWNDTKWHGPLVSHVGLPSGGFISLKRCWRRSTQGSLGWVSELFGIVWTWSTPTSKGLQSYVSKYLMAILGDYMRDIMCIYIYIINQFLNKPNSDLTVLMEFRHCWDSIWDTPELYWAGTFTSDIELQATLCFTPCMTQVFKMLVWEAAPNWKALKCWKHVFSCFFPNLPNL